MNLVKTRDFYGHTLVRVGHGLEKSSWQLAKSEPTVEPTIPVVGIEAADFPILNPAKSAEFNANDKNNVQGDGILWTKPLPGGKQVISYEAWLRLHRHPAGLELLDEYQAEMRTIAAGKSADGN